jgi:Domain of unknown function (DUF4355)
VPEPQPAQPEPASPSPEGERELVPKTQVDDARREAMQARNRVRELEAHAAELAKKAQSAEDRDKTELEKATGRAERLEKKIAQMEQQQARHEVAAAKQIPVELLEHVSGADRAVLEAFADGLLGYAKQVAEGAVEAAVAAADTAARQPRRSTDMVARGAPVSEPLDMNEYIRAGFRR